MMVNPYLDPNRRADPFGTKASYLEAKAPFDNTEEELKRLREQAVKAENPYKGITPLDEFERVSEYIVAPTLSNPIPVFTEDEERRVLYEQQLKKFTQIYSTKV